jgi:hypothetical protein
MESCAKALGLDAVFFTLPGVVLATFQHADKSTGEVHCQSRVWRPQCCIEQRKVKLQDC